MQRTKRRLVVCEQSAFKQTLPVILIYYKVSQPLLYTVMSFFLYLRVIYFTPWYFSVFFPFPIMWQWTIIHLFGCFLLYMSVKYEPRSQSPQQWHLSHILGLKQLHSSPCSSLGKLLPLSLSPIYPRRDPKTELTFQSENCFVWWDSLMPTRRAIPQK